MPVEAWQPTINRDTPGAVPQRISAERLSPQLAGLLRGQPQGTGSDGPAPGPRADELPTPGSTPTPPASADPFGARTALPQAGPSAALGRLPPTAGGSDPSLHLTGGSVLLDTELLGEAPRPLAESVVATQPSGLASRPRAPALVRFGVPLLGLFGVTLAGLAWVVLSTGEPARESVDAPRLDAPALPSAALRATAPLAAAPRTTSPDREPSPDSGHEASASRDPSRGGHAPRDGSAPRDSSSARDASSARKAITSGEPSRASKAPARTEQPARPTEAPSNTAAAPAAPRVEDTARFQQRVLAAIDASKQQKDAAIEKKLSSLLISLSLRPPSAAERTLLEEAERTLAVER
jgi:hypothetical protein